MTGQLILFAEFATKLPCSVDKGLDCMEKEL